MQLVPFKHLFVSISLLNGTSFQFFACFDSRKTRLRLRTSPGSHPVGFPAWIPLESASFGRLVVPSHNSKRIEGLQSKKNGLNKNRRGGGAGSAPEAEPAPFPTGAGSPAKFLWDCIPDILFVAPRSHSIPTLRETTAFAPGSDLIPAFLSFQPLRTGAPVRGEVVACRTPGARDKYWKI